MRLDMEGVKKAAGKAEKIFVAMGWTWTVRNHKKVASYVPDYIDILFILVDLSQDVGGNVSSAATGRLVAKLVDTGEEKEIRYYVSL